MNIFELLKHAVNQHASDLHLASSMRPFIRVNGDLCCIENSELITEDFLMRSLKEILSGKIFNERSHILELDASFTIPNLSRFRVNVFHQHHGLSAVFRVIPLKIPSIDLLHLPQSVKKLCELTNGLLLITGPTGSGKSSTMAAMIDYINTIEQKHILILEDPIEFIHKSKQCLVQQRDIKEHSKSFSSALKSALREDPDYILIGELRDLETIRLALTAAETGHLVLGTLHTNSAPDTINRILDVFPSTEKDMVRTLLSTSLRAVVSQKLIKKLVGGRIAAFEIMLCTTAIRNLIRENKIAQIYSVIQMGLDFGMITMEQSIQKLITQGLIADQNYLE